MKITIIGYGNMGQTYANSFISSGFVSNADIYVLNRSEIEKKKAFGIKKENLFTKSSPILFEADILIIAVKPQDFKSLSSEIKSFLKPDHVVLSVMAGITIQTMQETLGINKIVRSMPNIPTQIGEGMTVFCASQTVDRKELFIIQNLINTTGKSIYIEREEMLNADTAVSIGFTPSEAEFLVSQTFSGSVQLQNRSKLSNDEWIEKVASKGGTTEAALKIFSTFNLSKITNDAILAANNRSEELGKLFDKIN